MEIKLLIVSVIVFFATISALGFFHEYTSLKKKISDIEARMKKLENAKAKRMPYEAVENILDARAALNREKEEFQFFVSLIENAEAHLDKAVTVGTKREEK